MVVTPANFDDASAAFLHDCGIAVVRPEAARNGDADLGTAELAALLEGAGGWIIGRARVTRELLEACPQLLALSRRGVGYERVDIAAARDLKRVVTIAAGGNDDSVADHTIALILAVLRRLRENQMRLAAGAWSVLIGADLYDKTVGIVGFGRIGRKVHRRLAGFDVRVLVSAAPRHAADVRACGATPVDLPTLLAESDVVTLHAPLTPATRFLIDAAALALMKPTAAIVNTARGGLVHDGDLRAALDAGRLAGAGLDVFVSESDPSFAAVTQALVAMPTVVATPHAAASSREGLARTNRIAAHAVATVLDGGVPPAPCLVVDGR